MDKTGMSSYICEDCGGTITWFLVKPTACPYCMQRLVEEKAKELNKK